jgi:CubicO group peptidase (beta-lactamase class C family)
MMKKLFPLLFLFISIASQAQTPFTLSALKDSLQKIMEKEHIPGMMIALVHRDSVICQGGIGLASMENKIPVDHNSLFRIGSTTKTFTALSILKLVEQGKFKLDSKLKDIAPEIPFENQWEAEAPVRIIHLLEHTAGFDDMHFAAMMNTTGKKVSALEEALAHSKAMKSRWKPGTRWSYSNPGYAILGMLIEKYSGTDYQSFIRKTILEPLKMTNTTFDYKIESPYATGYSFDGEYHIAAPVVIMGGSAGAISSSASDMAKYVSFYLNEGKIDSLQLFSRDVIIDMEQSHSTVAANAGLTTGYGIANHARLNGGKTMQYFRGHSGGIMGFNSDMCYNRELGVGFMISNNGEAGNKEIRNKIIEFLTQAKSLPLPTGKALDKEKFKDWEGTYQLASPRNQILTFLENLFATSTISIKNDSLYIHDFLDAEKALVPFHGNWFRRKADTAPTLVLSEFDGSKVVDRNGDFLVKINPIGIWAQRIILGITFFCGILLVPFMISWVILFFRNKVKGNDLAQRAIPFFAFVSLCLMLFTFVDLGDLKNLVTANQINGRTLTIFITSLLIPAFSLAAIYSSVKNFNTTRSGFIKYFMLISALGFCYVSVYLLQYGWVGMRIWAF